MAVTDKEFLIRVRADIQQAVTELKRINAEVAGTGQAATRSSAGAATLTRFIRSMTAAAAGFVSIGLARQLILTADGYQVLQQRIRTATRETGDYADVSARISAISKENGVALRSSVDLFQRLARARGPLGATNEEILTLVDLVQKLGRIGGTSQNDLTLATVQLGQAFGAAKFQAQEVNSIIDSMPELVARIEKGLGLVPGTIKQAVEEGKVLRDDVFRGLLAQADDIVAQSREIAPSIEQTSSSLGTSLGEFLGKLDEATGLTRGLAETLRDASKAIDKGDVEEFLGVLEQIVAVATTLAAARIFGPAISAAAIFLASLKAINVQLLLAEARLALVARGGTALGAAMGLLGGPGGLIILAAAALAYFAVKANDASKETNRLVGSLGDLAGASDKAIAAKYAETLKAIESVSRRIAELEKTRAAGGIRGVGAERQIRALQDEERQLKVALAALEQTRRVRAQKSPAEAAPPVAAPRVVIDTRSAQAEASARLRQAELDAEQRALDEALAKNTISYREYYAERARIQTAALDAEISANQAALAEAQRDIAGADSESELESATERQIKLQTDLTLLRAERARVGEQAAADEAEAEKALADELIDIRQRLLEAQGQTAAAQTLQISREYDSLLRRLQAESDTAGADLVRRLINVEAARAQLEEFQREVDRAITEMTNREQGIQSQQAAGLLTELQAREQIVELHRQTAAEVEALIPKMQQLAQATGDPESIERIETLKSEVRELRVVVNTTTLQIRGAIQDNLTDAFEGVISGANGAKEAVNQFANSMLASLQRIAAEQLVQQFLGLFAAGAGSSTGFTGSQFHAGTAHTGGLVGAPLPQRAVSPLVFAGARRYHAGGLLPGEVPIIAMKGEEVITTSDPRHRNNATGRSTIIEQHVHIEALDSRDVLAKLEPVADQLGEMTRRRMAQLNR